MKKRARKLRQLYYKLYFMPGIRKKIIIAFVAIFILIVPLITTQIVSGIQQTRTYRAMIDNIGTASGLAMNLRKDIEPAVWNIVAGKTTFEHSGLASLLTDLRSRMEILRDDRYSSKNLMQVDVVLRTMDTLDKYVDILAEQVQERRPVAEAEETLEEIRSVSNLMSDLMQNFIGKQMNEISVLNDRISERSLMATVVSVFLLMLVLVISFIAVWAVSGSISRPIEKLRRMAAKIAQGDFHQRISLKLDDELSELAESMNSMAEQIELLLKKSIEEERNLKKSEMKTLQAQITPHFLYNTLDAIIWAAESNKSDDVIKLVTALSTFFRVTLSHGVDFIPLRDEIRHVENYLIIQKMRYSDILDYTIDVDESVMNEMVLKLLLQPLVENAIYHGIRNRRGGGHVTIEVHREGAAIRFSVSDTGAGVTEAELECMCQTMRFGPQSAPGGESGSAKKGFGLFNVNRRLELYYGEESCLEISSGQGKGMSVSFRLPFVLEPVI